MNLFQFVVPEVEVALKCEAGGADGIENAFLRKQSDWSYISEEAT